MPYKDKEEARQASKERMSERKRQDRMSNPNNIPVKPNIVAIEEAIQRGYVPEGTCIPIPKEWIPVSAVSLVKPKLCESIKIWRGK